MSKVIGIDLGTTNSCVAVLEGNKPTIIANAEGLRTTPSVVAYTKNNDQLVGQIAKRQAVINPENTFYSVKRFIGRRVDEVNKEAKEVAYMIERDYANVKIKCPILNKNFAPEELSARVLQKLVRDASDYLRETVTQAVITVPAYFNESQRQATMDAGKIAGLDVLYILNEPTAAALAYGLDKKDTERILVFDLGGGTFDVSILEVGDGVFEVLSTSGDTQLGGDDFDDAIVDYLVQTFHETEGVDLRQDKQALQRITEAAEKAKIELSYATQSEISLPFISVGPEGQKHLEVTLSRLKFEELAMHLINRCRIPLEQAMEDAKLTSSQLDQVILVGGSTRIPAVEEMLLGLFGHRVNKTVNPDEVVALGAALQASIRVGNVKDILLLDVTPLSLGVKTEGGRVSRMIARNTTIPTTVTKTFATANDNQTSVKINIIQGEKELANDNKSLGLFTMDGLLPAPRGETRIKVTFDIDACGLLRVLAIDEKSGLQQSVVISDSSTLKRSEVESMARDAHNNDRETNKSNSFDNESGYVFISYSSADEQISASAKLSLESKGLRCWRAPESINPGEVWENAITQAITRSSGIILIWSSRSQASLQVARELSLAARSGKKIIPFRIEEVEPEGTFAYYLTSTHWLDGITASMEESLEALGSEVVKILNAVD